VTERFHMKILGEEIPSIVGNPIKFLTKWFDDSIRDTNNSRRLEQQVCERLGNIDRTGLPGKFKA